jgi:uncharacterized protein YdaU (DUF1376 family)
MHYYQFNIADYRKDTAHLSIVEHGVYRQLLDLYYLEEKPIPKETQWVIRRLSLGSDSDILALNNVLSDFFKLENDGYHHARCDAEIASYHANAEKNRANGKKGGRPKKTQIATESSSYENNENPEKTQWVNLANPTETQPKGNQEPITNNHKPITNNQLKTNTAQSQAIDASQAQALDDAVQTEPVKPAKKPRAKKEDDETQINRLIQFFGISKQVAWDYLAIRKKKGCPATATACEGLMEEINKLNSFGVSMAPFEVIKKLCAKGWVSFEAEWWLPKTATARQNFYKKETVDEFMARTATTKDMPVELDVTPSQSWPQVDFLDDNPFA